MAELLAGRDGARVANCGVKSIDGGQRACERGGTTEAEPTKARGGRRAPSNSKSVVAGELHRVERKEAGWPRSSARSLKAGTQRRRGESSWGMEWTATRSRAAEWRRWQTAWEECCSAACHLIILLQLGQRLPAVAAGIGVGLAVDTAQE
uniref:Uncharacterized protein n=1 Tax=Oryza glumipatula TaxID=40148 RepID=A0A0E0BQK9_9ORYZ